MDARVSPIGLPPIEIHLSLSQALETQSLQRRPLCVADARLDLPFGQSSRMQVIGLVRIRLVFGSRILFIRCAASHFLSW